jgi:glycosyltransferase involved in cell wall biosynthesis
VRSIAVISSQAFSLVNFRGPLIRDLVAKGVTVYALAPDFDSHTHARVAALGAQPVAFSLARAGMNPLRDFVNTIQLRGILKRLAPDAALAYFVKPVIYGSLAAWSAGIAERYSMIEGLGYVFMDDVAGLAPRRRVLRYAVSRFYQLAMRANRKVFFLNREDREQFVREAIVTEQQAVQLDGIGLDLDHYSAVPSVLQPVTFLLAARMLKEKGIYDFIQAARQTRADFPQSRFLLVGGTDPNPGSVRQADLEGWVAEGLVEWPGQVADVRPWIARASVFVLPSYYREGVPRSNQEAMAMARPVITTDWVGCRETVRDGVNGYLVPVRDPHSLAMAMRRFLERPELIRTMGEQGRRIAEERFDVRAINRRILSALRLHD